MSGALDLHIVSALQAQWTYYAASAAQFRELFPEGVPTSTLDEWYDALASRVRPRTFHVFGQPGVEGGEDERLPDVAVELLSEEPEGTKLLGDGHRVNPSSRRQERVLLLRQRVRIDIFGYQPEVTRALHRAVVAMLVTALTAFIDAGYLTLDYEGLEQFTPEERLVYNRMEAYVASLRFSASYRLTLTTQAAALSTKTWWVRMHDIELDGRAGGVVPYEAE